jgi:predicted secreted protein
MMSPKSPILKRARAIVKTTVQEPVLPSDFFFMPTKKGYSFENMAIEFIIKPKIKLLHFEMKGFDK